LPGTGGKKDFLGNKKKKAPRRYEEGNLVFSTGKRGAAFGLEHAWNFGGGSHSKKKA